MPNEKTLILAVAKFEIQAALKGEDGKPKLPTFEMLAYTGAPMKLSGWRYPVIVDLDGLAIPSQQRPIRFSHDSMTGIGHTESISIQGGSLIARGVISRDTAEAKEVVASAKNGFPWQASIGASVESQADFVKEGESVEVNGRKIPGPVNVVRKSTLGEISFVDLGADGNTSATIAAKAAKELAMPDDDKKDEGKEVEAGKAETKPEEKKKEEPNTGGRADGMVAEAWRRRAIDDMTVSAQSEHQDDPEACERFRDLGQRHIEAKTSAKDFEIELLKEKRPLVYSKRGVDRQSGDVLAAAATIAGLGDEVAAETHGERAVESARKQFGRDIGLQEIMLKAAATNGYHGRQRVTVGNWREVWGFASGDIRAAGYSTVNLPYILGNVANKVAAKIASDPTWVAPLISGMASHANFHSHTVCSMGANGTLESVGPGGELKHMRLSEDTYTRQVGTRGAILRLSRTDIVNDDMGVFTRNAQTLIRKGYNAREKALFKLIIESGAGSSHFTAARTNYISGATTVPGTLTGMSAAVKAFRKLTGVDGEPINVDPAVVLVSPTYEAAMNALIGAAVPSLIVSRIETAAATPVFSGATNVYSGRFGGKAITSPWLENASAGGSDGSTAWYLFADPNILPCYEIAYLNGQQTPTVEYFGLESEADTLGVAWRIYWDFGVAAAEWRAGVKIAGA